MNNNEVISNVLNIFEKNVTSDIYDEKIEWDSLNLISIMVFLSEHYGVNEKPDNLDKLYKFKDLFAYLDSVIVKSIN
ncbi:acyl carrier protein [Fluviispira vulneris]|uniref:acyl carrier protein n=1 Tax=Fluviispira vulneris TaxID=2763012 RepID=UPI00164584B8|nr:acyl carrier protein [Fluviispira vulneris]